MKKVQFFYHASDYVLTIHVPCTDYQCRNDTSVECAICPSHYTRETHKPVQICILVIISDNVTSWVM